MVLNLIIAGNGIDYAPFVGTGSAHAVRSVAFWKIIGRLGSFRPKPSETCTIYNYICNTQYLSPCVSDLRLWCYDSDSTEYHSTDFYNLQTLSSSKAEPAPIFLSLRKDRSLHGSIILLYGCLPSAVDFASSLPRGSSPRFHVASCFSP